MKQIVLDGIQMINRYDTHSLIAEAMDFPEYYGKNLDALWDMLTTYDEAEIRFLHTDPMLQNLGLYGCHLLECFFEASDENPKLSFTIGE